MKRTTAYVLYTALLGVSIACVSSGLVYFPLKSQTFTIGLLAIGVASLVGSMLIVGKSNINQPDPTVRSVRTPTFGQRRPYLTVLIVWAIGVALSVFVKWLFMHSAA
ncbi:MAG: hypothetical protein KF744_01835 [Taibaiella sp.]|nr:hypothetical protein [Taibaiella sp.]